jgi:hypothetical protein
MSSCLFDANFKVSIPFGRSPVHFSRKYTVMNVKLKEITRSNDDEAAKIISEIFDQNYIFDFSKKDSVFLTPWFGMRFFGDTAFHCNVTKSDIVISNPENTHSIPYVDNKGIYTLTINSNTVESISMVPSWK